MREERDERERRERRERGERGEREEREERGERGEEREGERESTGDAKYYKTFSYFLRSNECCKHSAMGV